MLHIMCLLHQNLQFKAKPKGKEFWFYLMDKVFIEFLEVIGLNVLITIIVPVDY